MNYLRFRNLLKESAVSKELARSAGISSEYLDLLLGDRDISRPSHDTLVAVVMASCGKVSLRELETALEYDVGPDHTDMDRLGRKRPPESRAKMNMRDIEKGLKEIYKRSILWDSPSKILDTVKALYCRDCLSASVVGTRSIDPLRSIADSVLCRLTFALYPDTEKVMDQYFMLCVSRAGEKKYVLSGWAFDCESLSSSGWKYDSCPGVVPAFTESDVCFAVREKVSSRDDRLSEEAVDALLKQIFGSGRREDYYIESIRGIGFDIPPEADQEALAEFIRSRQGLVNSIMGREFPPEGNWLSVLTRFTGEGLRNGVGAFVASVMRAETGLPFDFLSDGEKEFFDNNPCVMLPDEEPSEKITDIVWRYAKELNIPEFGMKYFAARLAIDPELQFKTDEYEPKTFSQS